MELRDHRDLLRDVLMKLEWSGMPVQGQATCVNCGGLKPRHTRRCQLAAALSVQAKS